MQWLAPPRFSWHVQWRRSCPQHLTASRTLAHYGSTIIVDVPLKRATGQKISAFPAECPIHRSCAVGLTFQLARKAQRHRQGTV